MTTVRVWPRRTIYTKHQKLELFDQEVLGAPLLLLYKIVSDLERLEKNLNKTLKHGLLKKTY